MPVTLFPFSFPRKSNWRQIWVPVFSFKPHVILLSNIKLKCLWSFIKTLKKHWTCLCMFARQVRLNSMFMRGFAPAVSNSWISKNTLRNGWTSLISCSKSLIRWAGTPLYETKVRVKVNSSLFSVSETIELPEIKPVISMELTYTFFKRSKG